MLIALVGAAGLLSQQATPTWDRTCLDDNGRDVCAPAMRAELLERLGMASAEDEASASVRSYRAFFVDGYGRDLPAVAFERRPGMGPMSVVYGFDGARMAAPISPTTWSEIVAQSRFADRELAVPPSDGKAAAAPAICLHAWNVAIEMANSPVSRWRTEPVRRRFESACEGALTTRFAFFLAEEALKAQPHCQSLDVERQRGALGALSVCLRLKGDRVAASLVHDAKGEGAPRRELDRLDPGTWRAWLGTNGSPRLDWNGEVVQTDRGRDNRVAEFIVAQLREQPSLTFRPRDYDGVSETEVRVTGEAAYVTGDAASPDGAMSADYVQTWIWDPNLSNWMVSEWTVGPFVSRP